jgi:phenol 2-monooxygenase
MAQEKQVDVLICGSGSAGLCAAVWLARYGINFAVLERRDGPLKVGQADGVQCRTVEVFDSFGLAEDLLKESYHVLEVAFWSCPTTDDSNGAGIKRTHYAADKETSLSHHPHVILNQARLNDIMLGELERLGKDSRRIVYGSEVRSIQIDEHGAHDLDAYCVRAIANENGVETTYLAKYVLVS